jgi:hypothetical protein
MTFNLNEHTHRLMVREPFFASLSRRIDKMADKGIPTAGVRVNPETGYFELRYNPDFFEPLSDSHRTGVLVHEFYHLVFEHVTGRLPDELAGVMKSNNPTRAQAQLFKLWNIAAVAKTCQICVVSLVRVCLKICLSVKLLSGTLMLLKIKSKSKRDKRDSPPAAPLAAKNLIRIKLDNSMIMMDGANWMRQRKRRQKNV